MPTVISLRKTRKNAEMVKACILAYGCLSIDSKSRFRFVTFEDAEVIQWLCENENIKVAAYPFK